MHAVAAGPPTVQSKVEALRILLEARNAAESINEPSLKAIALFVIAGWEAYAEDVPAALKTAAVADQR
jgi:hypothetical protein